MVRVSITSCGIYVSGGLRLVRDGKAQPADVCVLCLRRILADDKGKLDQAPREED
jgi:hypothetical protein